MRAYSILLATAVAASSLLLAACGGAPSAVVPTNATPATAFLTPTPVSRVSTTSAAPATTTPGSAITTAQPASAGPANTTPVTTTSVVPSSSAASTPTASASATATAVPTTVPSSNATPATSSQSSTRYSVVPDGTQADYRVREQLVRLSAPSDAVGKTSDVTGNIMITSDGTIDPQQSKLVVNLTSLHSDSGMRDRFIQGNTLETDQFPDAIFVPTAIQGLSTPLPASGQQSFKLLGNLTVHGVTKPVTFDVTAQAKGNDVTGQATTSFTFEDFGMTPPKAGAVLSVVDNVKLEVTVHLSKNA